MKKLLLAGTVAAMALSSIVGLQAQAQESVELDFAAVETAYGPDMWPEIIDAYNQINPDVSAAQRAPDIPNILGALWAPERSSSSSRGVQWKKSSYWTGPEPRPAASAEYTKMCPASNLAQPQRKPP